MEPVLDDAGEPFSGMRYIPDAEGVPIKSQLWRGYYVTGMPGIQTRMDRLASELIPRPDDVFIYAYPKCGTHWLHEICHFLLTNQAEVRPPPKEFNMLEAEDIEQLDKIQSPRVLNGHMRSSIMPERLVKGNKIIYAVRNPKDAAVSLYHHETGISIFEYNGTFKGFLGLFENGTLEGGSWFEHTRDFLTAIEQGARNILMVEFEKLKRNPAAEIRRIGHFLLGDGRRITEELLSAICEKVSFNSMRKDRGGDFHQLFKDEASQKGFYRKGEIGDWKNYFDEESSRRIDDLCAKALKGLEHLYQPTYE